jgi:hypothetical protein
MAHTGDGGVGAAGGQANGDAAQPIVPNAAAAVNGVAVMVAPAPNLVALAPPAAPAGAAAAPAAVVLAAAPVAAMLALPVAPNMAVPPVGVPPRFDVDFALLGPLPTKTNFKGYETYPRVEEP